MSRFFLVAIVLVCLPVLARGEEWPRFRGPTGQGVSAEKSLPKWSRSENILWTANIPGDGWSSPIVWDDRVFVTTATEDGQSCRILALSRVDGKTLWNVEVCRQKRMNKNGKNSYATPTPVTDGENVYAVFNDGSIAAVTVEGKPVWVDRDVRYYSQGMVWAARPSCIRIRLSCPSTAVVQGKTRLWAGKNRGTNRAFWVWTGRRARSGGGPGGDCRASPIRPPSSSTRTAVIRWSATPGT